MEVDQLRPRRLDDDPHHRVVEGPNLGLPLGPLLRRHLVGAVHLEVLVGDAFDFVEHRFTSEQQDLRWVHLGVDGERHCRVPAQRRQLRRVRRGAHDDLGAVPGERDRDDPRGAVLGHVRQTGEVPVEHLLADRLLQDVGDVARRAPVVLERQVLGHGVSSCDSGPVARVHTGTEQKPQLSTRRQDFPAPSDTTAERRNRPRTPRAAGTGA